MMDLPELRTVDLEGPVAYREWEGPDDTAFVLVHGLGASHLSWVQVAEGLAGLGRVSRSISRASEVPLWPAEARV